MLELCTELRDESEHLVRNGDVDCWILDMQAYLYRQGVYFPIEDETEFDIQFEAWLETEEGQSYLSNGDLRKDKYTGELKFMRIKAVTLGQARDSRSMKLPIRDDWDSFIEDFAASAP